MQSSISSTQWREGDEITLTVTISNDDSIDFPLVLWVINYSSSDLSKTPQTLISEGKAFDYVIEDLETTQTVSSNHSNTTTLTPILIDAHNTAQGLSSAMYTTISNTEYTIGTTYNISYVLGDVVISGIVTWLKQWFYTKDEVDTKINDSGWQPLTLSSGYANYNSTEILQIRKIGKFVEIRGYIKPTAQKTASTSAVQFATIPSGYRPSYQFRSTICQGSGINRWHLTAETNGNLCWSRYGSTSSIAVPSGAWLCVHITYMVDS